MIKEGVGGGQNLLIKPPLTANNQVANIAVMNESNMSNSQNMNESSSIES